MAHQARVLWAIIIEDYYLADGMPARSLPRPDVLGRSLDFLGPDELRFLAGHLGPARSDTQAELVRRVRDSGFDVTHAGGSHKRQVHPGRAEAVEKYFTDTPPRQSPVMPTAGIVACLGMIVSGLVVGGVVLVVLLGLGGVVGYFSIERYIDYRRYLALRS